MNNDNTKPEFFALWSLRQLQVECARLNQVLKECIEITEKANSEKVLNPDDEGYTGAQERI